MRLKEQKVTKNEQKHQNEPVLRLLIFHIHEVCIYYVTLACMNIHIDMQFFDISICELQV